MIRLKCLYQHQYDYGQYENHFQHLMCDINVKEKLEKPVHGFCHQKGERNI